MTKVIRNVLLASAMSVSVILLSACHTAHKGDSLSVEDAPTPTATSAGVQSEAMETLHGFKQTGQRIDIAVSNNGCTQKEDFRIEVTSKGGSNSAITVFRDRYDGCRKRTELKTLTYTLKELGIAPDHTVTVNNAIKPFKKAGYR